MNVMKPLYFLLFFLAVHTLAEDPVGAAASLLTDRSRRAVAVAKLQQLARSKDPLTAVRAVLAVAPVLRERSPGKLEKLLEPYAAGKSENYRFPRIEGHAEYVRLVAHRGSLEEAIDLGRRAVEQGKKGLEQAIAKESLGDCAMIGGQFAKAVTQYQDALEEGGKHFRRRHIPVAGSQAASRPAPAKPNQEYWEKVVRRRIGEKLRKAQVRARGDKFGLDFALYELARKHQAAGHSKAALDLYEEIIRRFPKGVFAEAARFYRCLCLNSVKERVQALEAFIKAEPNGLYRGEAHYELGQIALTETFDVRKARQEFETAIAWCQSMRRGDRAVKLYTIPDKCLKVAKPLPMYQSIDSFGAIYKLELPPGQVINRQTASWYLNRLERNSRFSLIFVFFCLNKWDEAVAILKPVLDLDPELRRLQENKSPNTYYRYLVTCKIKRLAVDNYLFKGIDVNTRLRLHYAEFLYLQREFAEAERRLRALIRELRAKNDKTALPTAMLVLAYVVESNVAHDAPWKVVEKRYEERRQILLRITREFPDSPAAAQAHHCYARVMKNVGAKEISDEFIYHLRMAIKKGKGTIVERKALATLVCHYVAREREDEVKEDIKRLLKLEPRYKKTLDELRRSNEIAKRILKKMKKGENRIGEPFHHNL